jgi:S-adenosylmethionine synthetase
MNTTTPHTTPPTPRTSEDVLAGHPDRVCDAIAEAVVEAAHCHDPKALVGVEVALHRRVVYITGRVAASYNDAVHTDEPPDLSQPVLDRLVADAFVSAGYRDRWYHPVDVIADLDIGPLINDERAIRQYSDDQGIAVGYADPSTKNLLPVEHAFVRALREGLAAVRAAHADIFGPDGKVLVHLAPGDRPRCALVNVALQHVPGVGFDDLYRLLVPQLIAAADQFSVLIDLPARFDHDTLRINGIGDFTCGGPMGDNGLSGKKLVVDHYGPHVPIGGGAICGKDAHKPDRVGPLRARQIAVRLARTTGQRTLVHLGWVPGLEAPDRLWATLADGRVLDAEHISAVIQVPDLSLADSATELELANQPWQAIMREGYFGVDGRGWER